MLATPAAVPLFSWPLATAKLERHNARMTDVNCILRLRVKKWSSAEKDCVIKESKLADRPR